MKTSVFTVGNESKNDGHGNPDYGYKDDGVCLCLSPIWKCKGGIHGCYGHNTYRISVMDVSDRAVTMVEYGMKLEAVTQPHKVRTVVKGTECI